MQSAVLKMRRKSTEDFTFSAVIERTLIWEEAEKSMGGVWLQSNIYQKWTELFWGLV